MDEEYSQEETSSKELNHINEEEEETDFLEELYVARCKDSQDEPSFEEFHRFQRKLQNKIGIGKCVLRFQRFGPTAANVLSKYLRNRVDIRKLDIYGNQIKDTGLHMICHLLRLNSSIKMINLGSNDLDDKSVFNLVDIIKNSQINSLQIGTTESSIYENSFTCTTLNLLAQTISEGDHLNCLSINSSKLGPPPDNNIPNEAFQTLFSKCPTLRTLKICHCNVPSSSILFAIQNGFFQTSNLKRLEASHNRFSVEVGIAFSSAIKYQLEHHLSHLFYLDLSYNKFDSSVGFEFSKILKLTNFLGYLDLSGNSLEDFGAISMSKSLAENNSLVELHLASNKITDVGATQIFQALKNNSVLTTLNLSKNKLGTKVAGPISLFLQANHFIIDLRLASSMIDDQAGLQIAQATLLCPTLARLDLSNNFFTEKAGLEFEKIFSRNYQILKVDVSGTQIHHFILQSLSGLCRRNYQKVIEERNRPFQVQLAKSEVSSGELEIKKRILDQLENQYQTLDENLSQCEIKLEDIKTDEDITVIQIKKLIKEQEKEISDAKLSRQLKIESQEENQRKFELQAQKLKDQIASFERKSVDIKKRLDERKLVLQQKEAEVSASRNEILGEINKIRDGIDEITKINKDPNLLNEMTALPEFLPIQSPQIVLSSPNVEKHTAHSEAKHRKRRKVIKKTEN